MCRRPKLHKVSKKLPLDFIDLSSRRKSDTGVLDQTGYTYSQVRHVWQKYHRQIIATVRKMTKRSKAFEDSMYTDYYLVGVCFYVGLWYVHTYPQVRNVAATKFGNFGAVEVRDFYTLVVPVIFATAIEIEEIFWKDRLHPHNHGTGLFAQRFTTLVDCGGIPVQRPQDPVMENALFDKKSGKGHCWKMQIAINFLGWIVMYTGLHISKVSSTAFNPHTDDTTHNSGSGQYHI